MFAVSGFVLSEPAPYDGLLIVAIGASLTAGLRFHRFIAPLFVLIALTVAGDTIGSTQAADIAYATKHSLVTLYLSASAVFFACLAATVPHRLMSVTVPGMTLAALITGVTGIIGVLGLHDLTTELFTEFGRAKGTFKDANVMGPFLILPILFGTHRLMTRPLVRAWPWLVITGILTIAVFLSFSRGAWAHLLISGVAYMGIFILMAPSASARARAIFLGSIALVIAFVGIGTVLSFGKLDTLFEERAALTQSYDTGDKGRFAGQRKAMAMAAHHPLGLGAGDFANIHHGEEAHNVYINAFINGGWLGGFAYIGLVGATFFVGLGAVFRRSEIQPILMPVFAGFLGLALEGLIVDTDHWRHFYLIVGLIWGLAAHERHLIGHRKSITGRPAPA